MSRILPSGFRVFCLLLAAAAGVMVLSGAATFPERTAGEGVGSVESAERRTAPAVAAPAVAAPATARPAERRAQAMQDTLTVRVDAGEPLIASLPPTVGGEPVDRYRLLQAPALASVAGRSLLWVTRAQDAGTHHLPIAAHGTSTPPDTLHVEVVVE
jgi:hypothetical protein